MRTLVRRRFIDALGSSGAEVEAGLNAEINKHGWPRLLHALAGAIVSPIKCKAGKAAAFKGILADIDLHGINGPPALTR